MWRQGLEEAYEVADRRRGDDETHGQGKEGKSKERKGRLFRHRQRREEKNRSSRKDQVVEIDIKQRDTH